MADQLPEKRNLLLLDGPDWRRKSGALLPWLGAWGALVSLAVWLSQLTAIWLLPVLLGSAIWLVGVFGSRRPLHLTAAALLFAGGGTAAGIQYNLAAIENSWEKTRFEVEERSADALEEALTNLVVEGEETAAGAADAARFLSGRGPDPEVFRRLELLQSGSQVSAVGLFAPDGEALAWAGEHRGLIPDAARFGTTRYLFEQGPIFSYLYFTVPLDGGVVATAAFLLDSSVDVGDEDVPFADAFESRHGIRPLFLDPSRANAEAIWDWATDDGVYLSVAWEELTRVSWWGRVAHDGRIATGLLLLGTLLTLSSAWYRGGMRGSAVPVVVGTVALLIAPLAEILATDRLFSPLHFVLPLPGDVTLGALLVLLLGAATAMLARSGGEGNRAIPLPLALPLLVLVFPAAIFVVQRSSSEASLASSAAGGFPLQLATTLLAGIPLFLLLRSTTPGHVRARRTSALTLASVLLAALFAIALPLFWSPDRTLPSALAGVWALPAAMLFIAGDTGGRVPPSLRSWMLAAWLAGTASLAFLWPLHLEAELRSAERELALLGAEADPFLDFLLRQTADRAGALAAGGESGINLLYRSWVDSGLAEERYDAALALWNGAEMIAQLNLGESSALPDSISAELRASGNETFVRHYGGEEGVHYLLVAPLPSGETLTVTLPPRRYVGAAAPLARFLDPSDDAEAHSRGETLYFVPLDADAAATTIPASARKVAWTRTDEGWRSASVVRMPEGLVNAHLLVETPIFPLLVARGLLLQVGLVAAFALVWLLAKAACRELGSLSLLRFNWLRSFRGRLSLALSIFFLLPTLVFGVISYGAVAREVVRSAAALAQQSLDQAAGGGAGATLRQGLRAGGEDLLMYRDGTLSEATTPELLGLGLFHTWLPADVFLGFASGEDVQELDELRLGESDYLVAYRRLDSSRVLAAPIPLASHEITRRQTEFRDVALLVVLVGLALSLVLALFVSRALARPLDELSRAAMTVGAGNFRTALPESRPDEFGSVYLAFNRMVRRLRETRAALVQETRRTETIVAEAATGVLALDSEGRVELINPRAGQILGKSFRPGEPLLKAVGEGGAFEDAIRGLWFSPSHEASAELDLDGCIIRLKLRHLPGEGSGGNGAVVALEDVTAEVRTARVLAWGEMARQVAHEIKNPLTPIKLAVQHIRRAYKDGRSDYEEILERNVASILREIDRLGEIARAFSRFGTPAAVATPLEEVDVGRVVEEMLSLYRGSSEGPPITAELPALTLPTVVARTDELKEVLLNLLENAREASNEAENPIVVGVEVVDAARILLLSVSDRGVGIPEEFLDRIFEPHFSTRTSGTGLGLAIVRRIVDSWGGRIRAESHPGRGTRFVITLRVADTAPAPVHGLQPIELQSTNQDMEDQHDRSEER